MKWIFRLMAIFLGIVGVANGVLLVLTWNLGTSLFGFVLIGVSVWLAATLWSGHEHFRWVLPPAIIWALLMFLPGTANSTYNKMVGQANLQGGRILPGMAAVSTPSPDNGPPCVVPSYDLNGTGTSVTIERGSSGNVVIDGTSFEVTCTMTGQPIFQERSGAANDVGVSVVQNATATPTQTPTPSPTPTSSRECSNADAPASSYAEFDPVSEWDWEELDGQQQPTFDEFLTAHNLSRSDIQPFTPQSVSWEPAMYVVELTEENYGKTQIPLLEGYQYTVALSDHTVEVFWGGDESVSSACLQWGLTARWVPSYGKTNASAWLDPDNGLELVAREYRFGRYLRNTEMDSVRSDVPYFDRVGPYYTGSGNVDVNGWVPPSLDAFVPTSFMDACAMLGGLCRESEWIHGEERSGDGYLNWHWAYGAKVAGSASNCPVGDPCWQSVYVPTSATGYVELWLDAGAIGPGGIAVSQAGPYKFTWEDQEILLDGLHNVDEFTYHSVQGQ